jgi:hypothetical protein
MIKPMENIGMSQLNQIRERFLANARRHLLETDTKVCNGQFETGSNSPDCSIGETNLRLGKKED